VLSKAPIANRPLPAVVPGVQKGKRVLKVVAGVGAIERRVAMNEDELHSLLFRLFETQEKWILKDLIRETDQPTGHLKRSLDALCEYKRDVGEGVGTYRLKPEYKKQQ